MYLSVEAIDAKLYSCLPAIASTEPSALVKGQLSSELSTSDIAVLT